eukprot:scaffold23116_cov103-Isochrysis_galbana.AAC.9
MPTRSSGPRPDTYIPEAVTRSYECRRGISPAAAPAAGAATARRQPTLLTLWPAQVAARQAASDVVLARGCVPRATRRLRTGRGGSPCPFRSTHYRKRCFWLCRDQQVTQYGEAKSRTFHSLTAGQPRTRYAVGRRVSSGGVSTGLNREANHGAGVADNMEG